MRRLVVVLAVVLAGLTAGAPLAQQQPAAPVGSLDYEVFKTEVQPIFLKARPGLTRCYSCHSLEVREVGGGRAMLLQRLSPGATTWNEEQSRKNFEAVRLKVVPGNLQASRLLVHTLRYEAGGDISHGGGAQFASPLDPDWQTLAKWVMTGAKAGSK